MRLIGLTLALLASSLGARADSVEDRVTALEARVKALEAALEKQGGKPVAAGVATAIDGRYTAKLPNGVSISVEFDKGKVVAVSGNDTKAGTYEIVGQRVVITADGHAESLTIDGDKLLSENGSEKIEFIKSK